MKKISYVFIGCLLCLGSLSAQIGFGIKGGISSNYGDINGIADFINPSSNWDAGYHLGIKGTIPLDRHFSFSPELLFSERGFTIAESFNVPILGFNVPLGASAETDIKNIEIPLLLDYNIDISEALSLYITGGPVISYTHTAATNTEINTLIDFDIGTIDYDLSSDNISKWNTAAAIGIGTKIKKSNGYLFGDIRYIHGFTDYVDDTLIDLEIKTRSIDLSIGYMMEF